MSEERSELQKLKQVTKLPKWKWKPKKVGKHFWHKSSEFQIQVPRIREVRKIRKKNMQTDRMWIFYTYTADTERGCKGDDGRIERGDKEVSEEIQYTVRQNTGHRKWLVVLMNILHEWRNSYNQVACKIEM